MIDLSDSQIWLILGKKSTVHFFSYSIDLNSLKCKKVSFDTYIRETNQIKITAKRNFTVTVLVGFFYHFNNFFLE